MILEGCVGASLCSLHGFNIFGARAVFSMDACHLFPQCVLALIPLIRGCHWWCGDQRLHWMLSGAFFLPCGCHNPVRDCVCSLVVGVEAPRSVSELHV